MPLLTTGSPDISLLDYDVLFDISKKLPEVTLTNHSTQINAGNLHWVFELYSPSGTIIYKGNFTAPDASPWAAPFVVNETNGAFPKPNYQIEWSGLPYTAIVRVKDSANAIFFLSKPIKIKPPTGSTKEKKNTYGTTVVDATVQCAKAQAYFIDKTNYQYQGQSGVMVSKTFKLYFPKDESGDEPAPKTVGQFNSGAFDLKQSGDGHEYFLVSIFDYDLGDRTKVRVKYLGNEKIPVYCNIDITPVSCELNRLMETIQNGQCEDIAAAERKVALITPKLLQVIIAVQNPQMPLDPVKILNEINEIGGWDCNCCGAGIVPLASLASNGFTYEVIADSGDIVPGVTEIVGNNIRLHVGDTSYVLQMSDNDTAGFEVIENIAGSTKTFLIKITKDIFAQDLLNAISGNTVLRNQLNAMIAVTIGNTTISVDGKCVYQNSPVCDYTFATPSLAAVANILIKYFTIAGDQFGFSFLFDKTNAAALQTALNLAGIGTFVVNYAANILTITSAANKKDITALAYSDVNGEHNFTFQKNCTAIAPVQLNTFLQSTVDYICGLILARIKTGRGYTIKRLQGIGGAIDELSVNSTTPTSEFLDKLTDTLNQLTSIVSEVKEINCVNLKNFFVTSVLEFKDNDLVYGTKQGVCVGISPKDIALRIFKMGLTDQDVKNALCLATSHCGDAVCKPVTNASATYNSATQQLTTIITNTGANKYRVGYTNAQIPGPLLGVEEVVAGSGATTPHTWEGIAPGTYKIVIVAICASGESAEYSATSATCAAPTVFSVIKDDTNFIIAWAGVPAAVVKVRLEISYPNGGSFAANYVKGDNGETLPIPAGIFGNFIFRLRSVCDEAAQWYSDPTNDITVNVASLSSCPLVSNIITTAVTDTTMTVKCTKPAGTGLVAFTLRLTPQGGGAVINNTRNDAGDTVTWNMNGLVAGKTYHEEILTICSGAGGQETVSDPADGGLVTMAAVPGTNSTITNNTGASKHNLTVRVNGAAIWAQDDVANGASEQFNTSNQVNATVTVKCSPAFGGPPLCSIANGTLLSNGNLYVGVHTGSPSTLVFLNVDIVAGMVIEITP